MGSDSARECLSPHKSASVYSWSDVAVTGSASHEQLGSCVSFLGTGAAHLIGSRPRIPSMKILGGNKGALRVPFLSFQFLRRPGRTAKLLCFHTVGGFDPDRPFCHLYDR